MQTELCRFTDANYNGMLSKVKEFATQPVRNRHPYPFDSCHMQDLAPVDVNVFAELIESIRTNEYV